MRYFYPYANFNCQYRCLKIGLCDLLPGLLESITYFILVKDSSTVSTLIKTPNSTFHIVIWMQQGRIWHSGKTEFSVESLGKNTQKSEIKVILLLWHKTRHLKIRKKKEKRNLNTKQHLLQNDQNLRLCCIHMAIYRPPGSNIYIFKYCTFLNNSPFLHEYPVKGVLHPRPVFWLFMHFSQKLQHIGNK